MRRSFIWPLIFISILSGCVFNPNEVSITLRGDKLQKNKGDNLSTATVSNVQIINNQLVINGNNLTNVSNVKVKNNALTFDEGFTIESITSSKIIANGTKAISLAVNSVFDLVLSNAYGAASFTIDFSLCSATLASKTIDCSVALSDKAVLSYDAASQTWKPRQVNGLTYLGAWDAAANTTPAAQPAGTYYVVGVSGTIGGVFSVAVGDWIVSNGGSWQKIDNSTTITSVFGRTGVVVGQEGDYNLDKLADVDLTTTPPVFGKVLKYDGTHWVPSDDLSGGGAGSVTTSAIADGAVTDLKINSISASKITGTITSAQIADGTIVNADVSATAAIDYSKLNIPAGTIPYAKLNIADGDIPSTKISGLGTAVTSYIEDAINDTITGKAPSENAVYDALQLKLDKTGGTITSSLNVPTPILGTEAANKDYIDNSLNTATTTLNTSIGNKVSKAGDTMSGDLTLDTQIKLKSGSYYTTLKGSASATGNFTITLPTSAGISGYVLRTDGAGITSWINPASLAAGSGTVDSTAIVDGTIVDADISATANIAQSKISGLTTALSGKEPTISTGANTQYYRGDKTWQTLNSDAVTEGTTNLYFQNARVLGVPLTGFSATNSAIIATDSVLQAFNKTQGQIGAINTTLTNMSASQWTANGSDIYRASGNVGIGTTNPVRKFVVIDPENGKFQASFSDATDTYGVGITSNSSSASVGPMVSVRDAGNNFHSSLVLSSLYNQPMIFATDYSGGPPYETASITERMRLDSTGLGIGTNAPKTKLDVNGSVKIADDATACSATIAGAMRFHSNSVDYCNGTSWLTFSTTGTGSISTTQIADGTIVDADISASAAIAQSKISGLSTSLSNLQPLDATLTSLAAYNSNGILVQTSADVFTGRSIASTANRIVVTNGDGIAGNPTINIDATLLPSPVAGDAGKFLKATGANASTWTAFTSSDVTTALGFTPINKAGDTIASGTLTFNGAGILSVPTPTNLTDAVNKQYVDNLALPTQTGNTGKFLTTNGTSASWSTLSSSQWTTNGSDIYFNSGNVGIGTSTPSYKLSVENGSAGAVARFKGVSTWNSFEIYALDTNRTMIGDTNVNNSILFDTATSSLQFMTVNGTERMRINSSGNVGIGKNSPNSKLDVNGTINATNFSITGGNGDKVILKSYQDAGGNGSLYIGNNTGGFTSTGHETFFNTSVGHSSFVNNSSGSGNSVFGVYAFNQGTNGNYNTVVGTFAGQRISGDDNVLVGRSAGQGDSGGSTGSGNTLVGTNAANVLTTGYNNIVLGSNSGNALTSGSRNILIGQNINVSNATDANTLNIGNFIYGTSLTGTGTSVSPGFLGIGTASPQTKLDVNGAIRVGTDATACSSTISGAMRFNTPNVEYCNGTSWTAFAAGSSQPLDATLTSLAAYNANGILVQTSADTFAGRSIASTANRTVVTNGDGVSGNPTINVDTTLLPSPVLGDAGKFLKSTGANASAWTAFSSSDVTTALGFTPINKSGDTISTGTVTFNGTGVLSVPTPVNLTDAVNKSYVDGFGQWLKSGSDVYRTTGNVGIGTSGPTAPLHVVGGGTSYATALLVDTSAAAGGSTITLGNNSGSGDQVRIGVNGYLRSTAGTFGIDTTAAGTPLALSVNSSEKMRILNSGNVGIGTSSPSQMLTVAGVIESTSGGIKFPDGTTQTTSATSAGGTSFESSEITFASSPTNVLNAAHSLGSVPKKVQAVLRCKVAEYGYSVGDEVEVTQNGFYNWYYYFTVADSTNVTWLMGGTVFISRKDTAALSGINPSPSNWKLVLRAWSNGGGGTSNYWSQSGSNVYFNSGNIGVGTTNPTSKLHVSSAGSPVIKLQDTGYANTDILYSGWISGQDSTGTESWWVGEGSAGAKLVALAAPISGYDVRMSNAAGSVSLKSDGKVGIGTTNPSSHLHVYSNTPSGYTSLSIENAAAGGNRWSFLAGSTGSPLGPNLICLETGGVCRVNVDTTGNMVIGGTLTQSSDIRLKDNLIKLNNSLEKISSLNGYEYNWKDQTKNQSKQIGLIAQDVQKVYPEAVSKNEQGYLSVAYQNLIAPLIEAVKELKTWISKTETNLFENKREIATVKTQVYKQDEEIKKLREENEQLKRDLTEIKKSLKLKNK